MKKSTQEAVETLINGNISDFKTWLKRASKLDMLDAIEEWQAITENQTIINKMRNYLEA